MALPLLSTRLLSMNARVNSFALGGEEVNRQSPRSSRSKRDHNDFNTEVAQAYKQIYFHALKVDRESSLESQLFNGEITMRDFVRGLLLSSKFREYFYNCNSNYRIAEQVVGRVLGRPVHDKRESMAYSIVIAQQGLAAFVDSVLESDEYMQNFGYDNVPHQRSRVLPGQALGTMPFNQQAPRYGAYWRDITAKRAPAQFIWQNRIAQRPAWLVDAPAPWARRLWHNTVAAGGFAITGLVIWIAATMLSTGGR